MSSTGSGKRVVGEKGEKKDVVSSSPPATRTRAQTRADRAEMNPNWQPVSFHRYLFLATAPPKLV